MAVKLDLGSVRDAVEPTTFRVAQDLLAAGALGDIIASDGGAATVMTGDAGPRHEVWVGVADGQLTAECDCDDPDADGFCAHAVALTLAAIEAGFAWSSVATPPSAAQTDPTVRRFTELAATLPARRLAALVGEFAATDRQLQARLLVLAGALGTPTDQELATVRRAVDAIADDATTGRWGLEDIVRAGNRIVEEIEVLAQRPPTDGVLAVVEHAARRWDELSVSLQGTYYEIDHSSPDIGGALLTVHVELCDRLDVDPDDLAARLADIIEAAEGESCLDAPEEYRALADR